MECVKTYKNIKILYEDDMILVCVKPCGVPVQTKSIRTPDMESLLKSYLRTPFLGIIHRLDQPVEGLLVFAKTPQAAAAMNRQLTSDSFGKHYLAVICGVPDLPAGTLSSYLVKDGRTNTSRVCSPKTTGAKHAELSYKTLQTLDASTLALVQIQLKTGRHHQIRVQFADAGIPLWGDNKYNPDFQSTASYAPVALCAYRLCFSHPKTGKALEFEIKPSGEGFNPFTNK